MGLVPPVGNVERTTPSCVRTGPGVQARTHLGGAGTATIESVLIDRDGKVVKRRLDKNWDVLTQHLSRYESLFSEVGRDRVSPEVFTVRETMRGWRFYDHFRVDTDAPARHPQIGTRTLMLGHDGRDLATAWQTIVEIGDRAALDEAVSDVFPGARVETRHQPDGLFSLMFHQERLLRPLTIAELSEGTLRYLLLCVVLMVIDEPEASLHPDLTPARARLIRRRGMRNSGSCRTRSGSPPRWRKTRSATPLCWTSRFRRRRYSAKMRSTGQRLNDCQRENVLIRSRCVSPVTASSVMTAPLCGTMPPLVMANTRCSTSSGICAAFALAMNVSDMAASAILMPPDVDPVIPASELTEIAALMSGFGMLLTHRSRR